MKDLKNKIFLITAGLGAVSTILSFAFEVPTVAVVISAISGLISELGS